LNRLIESEDAQDVKIEKKEEQSEEKMYELTPEVKMNEKRECWCILCTCSSLKLVEFRWFELIAVELFDCS